MFGLGIHIQFRGRQLHQFRRALKGVQRKDAILIGQLQSLGYLGHAGLLLVAFGCLFLVDVFSLLHGRRRLFHGSRGVIAFPFACRLPVHQVHGQLLPVAAAFQGDIAHPVTHNLVFAHQLVVAVLQNEAVVGGHAGHVGLQWQGLLGLRRRGRCRQQKNRQETGQQQPQMRKYGHCPTV